MLQGTQKYRYLLKIVISFPLAIYPDVELLDRKVGLFLIFWGISILFSVVTLPIYIPTNSGKGFPFLHLLAVLVISCLFDNSHSNKCEITPHCGFAKWCPGIFVVLMWEKREKYVHSISLKVEVLVLVFLVCFGLCTIICMFLPLGRESINETFWW